MTLHDIQRVTSRMADIGGGVSVNRVLPTRGRRMIGAWCFLDHAGPAKFAPGGGMRVGPHPHIGLQTFTWMIAGEVLHRDSLGNVQIIRPNEVNLMTAGHGIAHTEESLADEDTLHAAQLWIALPEGASNCAPAFDHHPDLPRWSEHGCVHTLLAGTCQGHTAPAKLYSPLMGIDLYSEGGSHISVNLEPNFEYGVFILEGSVTIDAEAFTVNELAYLGQGRQTATLRLEADSRAILLGGEPFGSEVLMWWNFVGHNRPDIAQARRDWETGAARFGKVEGYDGAPLVAPKLPWLGY